MGEAEGSSHLRKRQHWADNAKGIGIVLVVVGHVIGGLTGAGLIRNSPTASSVYDFIYTFHMPLFFVVSGVFLSHTLERADFVREKASTILYPYIIWSLLQGGITILLGDAVNAPVSARSLLVGLAVAPIGQFWYLLVLFVLCLLVYFARLVSLSKSAILVGAVGMWTLFFVPSISDVIGTVPRAVCRNGIYFAFGLWVSRGMQKQCTIRTSFLTVGALLAGGIAWILRGLRLDMGLWPISAAIGSASVLCASYALGPRLAALRRLGRWSLPIYVGHVIAAAGTRIILVHLGVRWPAAHVALGVTGGVLGPAWLGYLRDKGHIGYLFELRRSSASRPAAR